LLLSHARDRVEAKELRPHGLARRPLLLCLLHPLRNLPRGHPSRWIVGENQPPCPYKMEETDMSQRYRKFQRTWRMYYAHDNITGNSVSLETRVAFQRGKHHFVSFDAFLEVAMNFGTALQAFDETMQPGLKGMVLDTSGIRLDFPHLRPFFHRERLASMKGQK